MCLGSRCYPNIIVEGRRNTTKSISQDVRDDTRTTDFQNASRKLYSKAKIFYVPYSKFITCCTVFLPDRITSFFLLQIPWSSSQFRFRITPNSETTNRFDIGRTFRTERRPITRPILAQNTRQKCGADRDPCLEEDSNP
jgi:hypothetical protein